MKPNEGGSLKTMEQLSVESSIVQEKLFVSFVLWPFCWKLIAEEGLSVKMSEHESVNSIKTCEKPTFHEEHELGQQSVTNWAEF